MKRILVTGGCGFIGATSCVCELETYPDVEITNLDALTYAGNPDNLEGLEDEPRYRFVHGDVADRGLVMELLAEGFDAVVHFAAESHVDRSIDDATPFLRTNVLGTQCLLDAARAAGTSPVRPGLDRRGLRHAPAPTTLPSPRRLPWPPTAPTPPARRGPTCSSGPRITPTG